MKKLRGVTTRITAMMLSVLLVIGSASGSVFASENDVNSDQSSEVAVEDISSKEEIAETPMDAAAEDIVENVDQGTEYVVENSDQTEESEEDASWESEDKYPEESLPAGDENMQEVSEDEVEFDINDESVSEDIIENYELDTAEESMNDSSEEEPIQDISDELSEIENKAQDLENSEVFSEDTDGEWEPEEDSPENDKKKDNNAEDGNVNEENIPVLYKDPSPIEEEFSPAKGNSFQGTSGECGEYPNSSDVKWSLTNDGILTINGDGKMKSWESVASPWKNNQDIKSIIVEDGVLNIGDCAFEGCSSVENIILGNDIQTIGYSAFMNCVKITTVDIPNSVISIGANAFAWCDNLKTISLPESVESIGMSAFFDCSSLESIIIPSKVTSLESQLFDGCSQLKTITLSDNIRDIGGNAFSNCSGLTSITLPKTLKTISCYVFENCTNLTSVLIPGSVEEIAFGAFQGTNGVEICGYAGTYAQVYAEEQGIDFRVISHTHFFEEIEFVDSNCLTDGEKRSICNECGLEKIEVIESKGHDIVIDEAVAPSCKKTGLTEGSHCASCGMVFIAQEEIAATGHTEVIDESKDATCTKSGLTEGSHCSVCGEILVDQKIIPATGHSVVLDDGKPATCMETGITEGTHCNVCGAVLIPQEIIPATGHVWNNEYIVDTEATCTDDGSKSLHCANCNATKDEKIIPATGHSFSEWSITKPSTIEEEGLQERTCSVCGFSEEETIPRISQSSSYPTVLLSQTRFIYNGQSQKPTVTVIDGDEEISTDYYTVTYSENTIDVGTYDITVEFNGIYMGGATLSYSIIPKEITPSVILSETTFTYNGEVQKPTVSVKDGTTPLDPSDYTVIYASGLKNVGSYEVMVEMKGNYSGTGTATYKINAKAITPVVTLSKTSYTYNGKVQKPSVTVTDGTNTFASSNYTVSYASGLKNAGSYKVTVEMKGNYSGTGTATYKINAKAITPAITLSKTSFIYNGKVQKPTVSVQDGTTTLASSDYTVTYASGLKNVGSYKVTVKMKGNYSGSGTATYKITAKTITPVVTLSKTSYVYNGEIQKPTVTVKTGTTKLAASNYDVIYASGRKNAGTYKVTVKMKGNYSGSKTVSFKINPKKVTPSVTLSKKVYVYNGEIQKPTAIVKLGSTKLDSSKYTVVFSKGLKNVGSYNVTIKLKGNYTGTKTVSYKIIPKSTKITSAVGTKQLITVKWTKQATQVSGYQIQYSLSKSFASGNKITTITKAGTTTKTITKPTAGKNYYVRIRTYKTVGTTKYYSAWSEGAYTAIRQTIKKSASITLDSKYDDYYYYDEDEIPQTDTSFTFTTTNRMVFVVPIKLSTGGWGSKGGIRIILKNKSGQVLQNDFINVKNIKSLDEWEGWFYNDDFLVSPGTYTYTIKNTSDTSVDITYSIVSFLKIANTATVSKEVSVESGNWVRIGKIGEGCPHTLVTYPDNKIITGWHVELDGTLWVYADKKGISNVTVKLDGGGKYTCKVNVTAGEPDFDAYLTGYYTRDNYFEVEVQNNRFSDLTIIRKGAKVEEVAYKSNDRYIKKADNVIVKSGEKKTIRFYVDGSTTWYNYKDYTLCSKFVFEDRTYNWHVWYSDSVYQKGEKWYKTYWD